MKGPIDSSPIVAADGTVYVVAGDATLYALTPSGTKKWSVSLGQDSSASTAGAIGVDGTIYIAHGPNAYAIRPDGTTSWMFSAGETFSDGVTTKGPAIDATHIYFSTTKPSILALTKTGTADWEVRFPSSAWTVSRPTLGPDGNLFVSADEVGATAVSPSGTIAWQVDAGQSAIGSTIASDGTVYIASTTGGTPYGTLYALSPAGTIVWQLDLGMTIGGVAIAADGTLRVATQSSPDASADGRLFAVTAKGALMWAKNLGAPLLDAPVVDAAGTSYMGVGYNMSAVDETGTLRWEFPAANVVVSQGALAADGTLYFGCSDGTFYAVGD
jgi:outer membrane protein assembly factor BamB